MTKTIATIVAVCSVLFLTGEAAPAGVIKTSSPLDIPPDNQCLPPERIVAVCGASVCADEHRIVYRYSDPQRGGIEIASDGTDGRVYQSGVVGGGGGHATNLRFVNGDYSYVLFSGEAGSLTDIPGQQWSGLVVMKGDTIIGRKDCAPQGRHWLSQSNIPSFVPEDTDDRFRGWF